MTHKISVRAAQKQDSATILRFVKELARYEHLEHEVKASVEDVDRAIFGEDSTTHAVICYVNEEPIGFAVYFVNYSTWLGKTDSTWKIYMFLLSTEMLVQGKRC
ncbi:hypothetical protein P3538_00975 [Vibrio parahaemolyticus]|uniref:hypothetical protein n=1 Tax=Vibrio parahaemolyticus TaxID=670 RepID=UPI002152F6C6|nr:hypothetical protein [Vibrio parahaemolyticus]MDF4673016.1 hypothetical protein [Vibrio parahaemolyticus]